MKAKVTCDTGINHSGDIIDVEPLIGYGGVPHKNYYIDKLGSAWHDDFLEFIEEPFQLSNEPPDSPDWQPESDDDRHPEQVQRKLFSGLDCLPNQQDLFDCDGAGE